MNLLRPKKESVAVDIDKKTSIDRNKQEKKPLRDTKLLRVTLNDKDELKNFRNKKRLDKDNEKQVEKEKLINKKSKVRELVLPKSMQTSTYKNKKIKEQISPLI